MHGAFGIILDRKNEQVLLVKRRDMPVWVLPGGHIEISETPEVAVIREVLEETGYNVSIIKKVGEYSYHNNNKIQYTYLCRIIGGEATLSKESKLVEYYNLDKLPDLISPYAPKMIHDALSNSNEIVKHQFERLSIRLKLKALLHPWAFFKFVLVKLGIHWNT